MVDLSHYPFPTYLPNKTVASIFAAFVFLSLLRWFIQSTQNHFQPIRLVIPLLLSHLTILIELLIRTASNLVQEKSKPSYLTMTVLYTIGQRTVIIANFTYLIQFCHEKSKRSRWIILGVSGSIILADIMMAPAGFLSFELNRIQLSFIFRQISTSIICLVTLAFYPLWLWTRTFSSMSYESIVLLIISSFNCVLVAFFLLVMSIPQYYIKFNDDEQYFYLLQILPIILALMSWSLLHPKRSFQIRNELDIENDSDEKRKSYAF